MQYDENAEKYGYEGEMTPLKCDKLTAYKGDVTIPVYGTIADAEVYLKKEADKVIAELKQKINEVETELELWRDGSIISEEHQKELDGKRHSDYKRCLAMAKWCNECHTFNETNEKRTWLHKWHKCWLELAEKFKEEI